MNNIFDLLNTDMLIKIGVLILLVFYSIFSLVIVNQVRVMNRIITQSFSPVLFFIAILHALAAISLFLFALAIL